MEESLDLLGFKTKKELKEHTQKLMKENRDRSLTGNDHLFVVSLLGRHPESEIKIGCGVSKIEVLRTSFGNYGFYLTRTDGSKIDFSYKVCIDKKPKDVKFYLTQAMRMAISDQTTKFKKENYKDPFICPLCRTHIENYKDIHVDHVDKKFKDLAGKFLDQNRIHPTLFDDCPTYHTAIFTENDHKFDNDWRNYHLKNATLRLICSKCNSKEG